MRKCTVFSAALTICFALGAGCNNSPPPPAAATVTTSSLDKTLADAQNGDFDSALLEIAREYKKWVRVSDSARQAPTDCSIHPPVGTQLSQSADPDTHGRKLYFLFAKDSEAYQRISFPRAFYVGEDADKPEVKRSPIGQVLVKESWEPVEVDRASVPTVPNAGILELQIPAEYAIVGEKAYRTGDKSGLFVMFKVDPGTAGTDAGWVYGTVTADGSRVIQAGKIESCMGCHVKTDRDRLFGLPRGRS